jgi:peroxiredoxin
MNRLLAAAFAMASLLLPMKGADIPRQAPELKIPLPGGQQILLSQYRGKAVVLEFLLTTCPHCQFASRTLERLYRQYKPRGVEVIGVGTNKDAMTLVPEFVRSQQLTFPVGAIPDPDAMDFLQHSPIVIMYMPQLVFIDKKGVIQAQYGGDDAKFFAEPDQERNFRIEIEKLLLPRKKAVGNAK